ncbi:MinD/ParA family protein [Desulfurobacterium indicum]|uniref:Flagellar biosynthesis switch protein FlhG n=1 Tax=Desulfurobacterium indicum TaxID=1914305 RepID=A0A1R1MKX8_9BACT|nr:MinD/ParA family protein [Desulfurobacterium indicum]OMH40354.1 flagellar biosynthesis switch protein FlhG [Desulfurobacterium indicum]
MNIQAEKLIELVKERHNPKKRRAKFICVASGKGGVGKTNFSVNFSYILSSIFGKRVLLLDGDVGLGNVHVLLGLSPDKNLKMLMKGAEVEDVIQHFEYLDVLLGFSGIDTFQELEDLDVVTVINKLEKISDDYDFIVLDASAGINENVLKFAVSSDTTYVITTPEPTAITDAYALIKSLYKLYKYDSIKLVANMCKNKNEGFSILERIRRSCENFFSFRPKIAGVLPDSNNVKISVRYREPVATAFPADPYTLAIKEIASLETGEIVKDESESFWRKLKNFFKVKG